ncbi:hypothetical protein WN943_019653 [Citrus x changshan-huyou]
MEDDQIEMVTENVGDNGDWMIRLREDRALRDGHRRWGCQGSLACCKDKRVVWLQRK